MHSFKVNSISRKRFIGSLLSFISVPFIPKTWGSPQEGYFKHGVASGDPQQDRVIIWTRVSPPNTSEAVVVWEVATDSNFRKLVKKGKFSTSEARDFTVKIDVTGLEARSEEHTSELQSRENLVCRLLLEKKKKEIE